MKAALYKIKVFDNPVEDSSQNLSKKEKDWALIGYWFFEAGSLCYFFQAILPVVSCVNRLQKYQIERISLWLGVNASIIFVVESFIYLYGWQLGRKSLPNTRPFFKDWNFWGNILFIIGSVGYLLTSIAQLLDSFLLQAAILNLILAVLFVFDSVFYLLALFEGIHSKAPGNNNTTQTIQANLDYYLQGTLFFIVGSLVYLAAAIFDMMKVNSSSLYVLGACVFLIDAPLYILSGFQIRDDAHEVAFFERSNIFCVEVRIEANPTAPK